MKEICFPPVWCKDICKHALSDACVEECAVKRNCENFRIKPFEFDDLPPYPLEDFETMSKEEKIYSLAIYTAKLTEKIQEVENGQLPKIRQDNDNTRSRTIFKDVKK